MIIATTPSKKKKLTKKQELAIAALVDPNVKTAREAAKMAGMDEAYLCRMSKNVNFQEALQTAKEEFLAKLEKKGIGLDAAANTMANGFTAVTAGQFGGDPDYKTRLSYLETFLRIKGVLSDGKEPVKNTQVNVYNFRDEKTEDLVRSIREHISARLRCKPGGEGNPISGL